MIYSKLPPELISLVYHIELNKAGWWEKAVQRLILGVLWLNGENLKLDSVVYYLMVDFDVRISRQKANALADDLFSSGILIRLQNGGLKIAESVRKNFEQEIKETEEVEGRTKDIFISLLKTHCPSLNSDETWNLFNDDFLVPLIYEIGAGTYQLISGTELDLPQLKFDDFLKRFHYELHSSLRTTISSFLDPQNDDVRSYILRYLNAFFFVEAGNLKVATLNTLKNLIDSKPTFTVFVDTNFIFSILNMHENPSNESALLLAELIKQIEDEAQVKMYILPPTVEEAQRVLIAVKNKLSGIRLTPNLAEAALEADLSGINQRYFEETSKRVTPLSPEVYFDPYIKNLLTILKTKGVEYYNKRLDQFKTFQIVIDDIMTQLPHEEQKYGSKAKSYERLEHDMVLWHYVKGIRPAAMDSPLDAEYWVVTIDYRFIGFDLYKRRNIVNSVPICIHPSSLIQMLQLWVPRTPQFEKALLSSIRIPFLFQEFDSDAEKLTITILKQISRWEEAGDMPKETVAAMILNDALRQKLSFESDSERQAVLVKEALIAEHQKTKEKLKDAQGQAEQLKKASDEKDIIILELQQEFEIQKGHLEKTTNRLEQEQSERMSLESRINQLEVLGRTKEEMEVQRKQIRAFLLKWVSAPVLLIIIFAIGISWFLMRSQQWGFVWSVVGIWSLCMLVLVWVIDRRGLANPTINALPSFRTFHRLKRWLFTILVGLTLGFVANLLYDKYKSTNQGTPPASAIQPKSSP